MSAQSGIFKGTPYMAPYGTAALASLGNTAKISHNAEVEEKELPDYENPGGGIADSVTRLKSAKVTLELKKVSAKNLALAFGGDLTAITAGAVTAEEHEATLGALIPLNKPQDMSAILTVKDSTDTDTYVEGEDYTRVRAGVILLESGDIADEELIKIAYTALAGNTIEGLINLTDEYHLLVDGINERDNKPVLADYYRVKFGPAKNVEWIGDDFVSLTLEGTVLKDETKTGTGVSQYFSVRTGW